MNIVIGCGGVASWLVPKLVRLERELTLIDGDTLEKKNLDRQLFDHSYIGWNKAHALSDKYSSHAAGDQEIAFNENYYSVGLMQFQRDDILWCCADNHSCRREVLMACDQYRCKAILAANEYTDAEAYLYDPTCMYDSLNDPRVVYPNILTDHSDDPLRPAGCVEASRASPQLVLANAWAADMALHLWWFWTREAKKLPADTKPHWPIHHKVSAMKWQTIRFADRQTD